ncbi:MAG TPA: hypothetical protein VIW21_03480 [Chthoniobacterales bacterium]|jgi:hypothetical protein
MKLARLSRRDQLLVACAPISERRIDDRGLRAAVTRAGKSPELKNQQEFDRAVAKLVGDLHIPPEIAAWFSSEALVARPKWTWKRVAKNPAFVAIGIALVVIASVFVIKFVEHLHDFPGSSKARRLLSVANSSRSVLLDPIRTDAGALGDLFFMKHNLEHYEVPPEFADFQTLGCRVFDDEEAGRVAQIWVTEKRMQFFLFPAERDPKTGTAADFSDWRFVDQEGWSGVVQQQHGVLFMAAIRGDRQQLAPYLKKAQE